MNKGPQGHGLAVAALLLNAMVWGVSWWPFQTLQAQGLHPLPVDFAVVALGPLRKSPRRVAERPLGDDALAGGRGTRQHFM